MVAYFYRSEEQIFWPRYEAAAPMGLPILKVALPRNYSPRRLKRTAGRLYRRGLRRFLPGDPRLDPAPLVPVSPLPLLRAKGAELALALLSGLPPRERRIALRGGAAGPEAWAIAEDLCPRVGALLLDFDRGEEALAHHLRQRFGAASLHLGQGQGPQAAVELDFRPASVPQTLRLWGEPDLLGLTLSPGEPLPLLELLWETGRVELKDLLVNGLDRRAENTYNNRTVL